MRGRERNRGKGNYWEEERRSKREGRKRGKGRNGGLRGGEGVVSR